jgi:hypothetical protein
MVANPDIRRISTAKSAARLEFEGKQSAKRALIVPRTDWFGNLRPSGHNDPPWATVATIARSLKGWPVDETVLPAD